MEYIKIKFNVMCFSFSVKSELYERVVLSTVMYGVKLRGMGTDQKRKLNLLEIKCTQSMCRVTMIVGWRIEEVKHRNGV